MRVSVGKTIKINQLEMVILYHLFLQGVGTGVDDCFANIISYISHFSLTYIIFSIEIEKHK